MSSDDELLKQLQYLRKGPGYEPGRLARLHVARAVLGGLDEPEPVLKERLISAIYSLRDADRMVLEAAFGLAEVFRGNTLAQRRDLVADQLGLGREAVADRDAAALRRLTFQLRTGWYPKSPTGLRVPASHNGFLHDSLTIETTVRNRRHVVSRHAYALVPLFDEIPAYTWVSQPDARIVVTSPGFHVHTEEIASGLRHVFKAIKPMQQGRLYRLSFELWNPNPGEIYELTEESMAFHEPTRHAEFTVTFEGELPQGCWSFSGLTLYERPGTIATGESLPIGRECQARFTERHGGLYSGIAWRW